MKAVLKSRWFLVSVLAILLGVGGGIIYHAVYFVGHFATVKDGVLYRCAQPEGVKWSVLKRYGIRAVVDLRPRQEDAAAYDEEDLTCEKAGVKFVGIPIPNSVVFPDSSQIRLFLQTVQNSPPVLIHCQHGRKRTGILVGAYRVVVDDWSVEEAMVEMEKYQANLREMEPQARKLLTELKADRQKWLAPEAPASKPAAK